MPKISVVLGRRTLNVFELERDRVTVGRAPDSDIPIDNVSVSRQHAEIFKTDDGWMVRDLNSSNGTFLNDERITQPQSLRRGDEISIGKFSLFFERVLGDESQAKTRKTLTPEEEGAEAEKAPEPASKPEPPAPPAGTPAGGTRYFKPEEIEQLRKASAERRKAKVEWEAGGQKGERALPEEGALLIGKGDLCDLQTPKGPKHHLLLTRSGERWEARNLSWWHGMKVNGRKLSRTPLPDGATIEIAGLTVTYHAEVT